MINQTAPIDELIQTHVVNKTLEQRVEKNTKKRKKKPKNYYFTLETENAIILYNALEDPTKRNIVFERYIKVPIYKLVESVFNTFKFMYFDDSDEDVQQSVVSEIILKLDKFQEGKGKAFSYFSIVAKNYLIHANNKNYDMFNKHTLISKMPENWELEDDFWKRQRHRESNEFIQLMVSFWEDVIPDMFDKELDIEIAYAILELFKKSSSIETFNKKALYLYIREMTDCKTQYITKVVKVMKSIHTEMIDEYRTTGSIDNTTLKYCGVSNET